MRPRVLWTLLATAAALAHPAAGRAQSFVTFETGHVRPLALSPDTTRLFAVNTPDNRLEIFDVSGGGLVHVDSVPVGLEPIAVAARTNGEVWVVNHLSDSVSIVDVASARVTRTLLTCDEPRDIVFASGRAFITTARRGQNCRGAGGVAIDPKLTIEGTGRALVQVFDPANLGASLEGTPLTTIELFGDTPRALAASPDGTTVYAAVFHSGNRTTTISEGLVCNSAFNQSCTVSGSSMPGGLPPPKTNCDGDPQPEVGLIVKFDPTIPPSGRWVDELGRNWNNAVRFSLPDEDVFAINASASPPAQTGLPWTGVGTILFNMVANPVSGRVYVSNTNARNEVRFEGPGSCSTTVRGHLHEARITVLDGVNANARHLNKQLDTSPSYANPSAADKAKSLATPLEMVVTPDGSTLYVAAFGSSQVGIFDTAQLEANTFTPNAANHIPVSGGGPSGLVLRGNRLYVFTRFDNAISVVDTGTKAELDHVPVYNPEPDSVVDGRPVLYDAVATSANGEAACAACHVFGDFDSLAWDLGNPDEVEATSFNPIDFNVGQNPNFRPLKGPMTTQSLRGMANHGPMHWRGDRSGGAFANDPAALDENLAFLKFIVAFDGLLGRNGPIPDADMQKFSDFILQVTYPPNPIRNLDNTLTNPLAPAASQQRGRDKYLAPCTPFQNPPDPDCTDTVRNCNGCHRLEPQNGFFGSRGFSSFENETQIVKIPHLRNMYQKVGMFGMPAVQFIKSGNNGNLGPQVRGFGFLHDGSIDTLFRFHNATVFLLNDQEELDMEAFMMAFDSNLAPIVGQQITLTSTNAVTVGPRIDLLIARAAANECDLTVKGNLAGQQRGWVRQANGVFKSDQGTETHTDAQLRTQAATAGQERTYTCVPPGSGQRIGINRDEDACLDADDAAPADPGNCSVGTTTSSTTTSSTSTTTIPGSCTDVPVGDPKASVKLTTRNEAGRLSAKMSIDLASYGSEAVTVSLGDFDTPTIATQGVGSLPPAGSSGKRWLYKSTSDGVYKVTLKDLSPRLPNTFKVSVKARQWFSAAAANQEASNTFLTVRIGDLCFTHGVTKKTD